MLLLLVRRKIPPRRSSGFKLKQKELTSRSIHSSAQQLLTEKARRVCILHIAQQLYTSTYKLFSVIARRSLFREYSTSTTFGFRGVSFIFLFRFSCSSCVNVSLSLPPLYTLATARIITLDEVQHFPSHFQSSYYVLVSFWLLLFRFFLFFEKITLMMKGLGEGNKKKKLKLLVVPKQVGIFSVFVPFFSPIEKWRSDVMR